VRLQWAVTLPASRVRRIHDLGGLTHVELRLASERELERLRPKRKSGGDDFYRTQGVRLGRRFARALVA